MKTNKKAAVLATAAIAGMALSGCGSQADKIDKLIDQAKYDEAIKTFDNWRDIKEKDWNELVVRLGEDLEEGVDQYALEEISYEGVAALIDAISSMHISDLDGEVSLARTSVESLRYSKQSFASGCEAYEEGDYLTAMYYFSEVVERDCNYEEATRKGEEVLKAYADDVIARAEQMAAAGDYYGAFNLLEEARMNVYDTTPFDNAIEALTKKQVISQAEQYARNNDYESALGVLNEYIDYHSANDSEINALHDKYTTDYVNMISSRVNALRSEKKYLKALEILDNASDVVDAPAFGTLREEINKERPIYLCELETQYSSRFEQIDSSSTLTDTSDRTYEGGNLFEINSSSGWSSYDGYAEYYLGYKYNTLQGVVAVDSSSDDVSCTLYIKGDGEVLKSFEWNRASGPMPITVDVSSVNDLRFETGDLNGSGSFYFILADMSFS